MRGRGKSAGFCHEFRTPWRQTLCSARIAPSWLRTIIRGALPISIVSYRQFWYFGFHSGKHPGSSKAKLRFHPSDPRAAVWHFSLIIVLDS
jgi:hypothetical protein